MDRAEHYREPKVRGCGEGNVKALLESGDLGGKCADLNALFVGLCRSVGMPARDLYGVRLAPSRFGYKELGGNSANLSGAQHCLSVRGRLTGPDSEPSLATSNSLAESGLWEKPQ